MKKEYIKSFGEKCRKELLENVAMSIGEVGVQVGYTSSAYFCDAFKQKVGVSPSVYRKQLQAPRK